MYLYLWCRVGPRLSKVPLAASFFFLSCFLWSFITPSPNNEKLYRLWLLIDDWVTWKHCGIVQWLLFLKKSKTFVLNFYTVLQGTGTVCVCVCVCVCVWFCLSVYVSVYLWIWERFSTIEWDFLAFKVVLLCIHCVGLGIKRKSSISKSLICGFGLILLLLLVVLVVFNTHTPLTRRSWSGLTMVSRHSVGELSGKLAHTQLFRQSSATIVLARWTTVGWS